MEVFYLWYTFFMSKVIIVRGPSGSGKSSVAKRLHEEAKENTALLVRDVFRVDIAKEQKNAGEITTDIIEYAAKKFLDNDYTVILEGIFSYKKYSDFIKRIIDYNKEGDNYLFYLNVSLEETLKRNKNRPKSKIIDDEHIKKWYEKSDKTNLAEEETIDAELMSFDEVISYISKKCKLELDPDNYKKNIKASIN